MCGSMVDIQSLTAEIRRGKNKKKKEEETTAWKYIWPALLHRAAINKSSAVAEMGDHLAIIDMGQKAGAAVPFSVGEAGSPSNTISPGPRPTSVPSGILIHPAIWPQQTWAKSGGGLLCPFLGQKLGPYLPQCSLGRGLPPHQVTSWSIQPFGHNRHGPKGGLLCRLFMVGELCPHLTQCGPNQGLPSYQVAS